MTVSIPTMAAIRYGYGLKPGEENAPANAADLMKQVTRGATAKPRFPREGFEGRRETALRLLSVRAAEAKTAQAGKPNAELRRNTLREADRMLRRDSFARIMQAVYSQNGFFERLASFWVDHFSVNARKTYAMRMIVPLFEGEAIRPHIGGPFVNLLHAAVLHPAMLFYLDQNRSVGPESQAGLRNGTGLNENLGRELLELHTMGAGSGYTQDDVRGASLVLTGVSVDARTLEVAYRRARAEPGRLSLLGKAYGEEGRSEADHVAMLDDLARRPETARHLCAKLVRHFIADEPPVEVIDAMVAAWTGSDGNLTAVYQAMLDHPRAWQGEGQKFKQPFDFVVSGLRALDVKEMEMTALAKVLDDEDAEVPLRPDEAEDGDDMAQAERPGPRGADMGRPDAASDLQDGASSDIKKSATKAAAPKPGFARALTFGALRRMGQPVWQPPSPAGFGDDAGAWLSASQLSERIAWARLAVRGLGRDLDPPTFLTTALADAARPETVQIVAQAPNKVHGLTMVLVSPEFNRR
ncbi:DUF1800 domain-containing protein [Neorhizobium sp. NPDC001467]|uniref:DUF1800 domain-containing protein n=1 Tax=Neorhizobium sp. NPDC001467 TaxID=3390595 RepID=UPI003D035E4E